MSESDGVVLRDERRPRVSTHLTARITEDGDLLISGQDIGDAVEEFWHDLDFEYFLKVESAHLDALLRLLREELSLEPREVTSPRERNRLLLESLRALYSQQRFT